MYAAIGREMFNTGSPFVSPAAVLIHNVQENRWTAEPITGATPTDFYPRPPFLVARTINPP